MNFIAVVEQVLILGVVIFIGFVAAKTGYIDIKIKDALSKVIVNVILPCLIISSISEKDFEPGMAGELLAVFLMSLFCIITLFGIGILVAKVFKIPDHTAKVHKLLSALGNVIFLGYPIVNAIYGEKGVFYAILYWLLNDMFLWTVGVVMLSEKREGEKLSFSKKLLNANTISFVAALVMFFAGIKLPPVINSAVSGVGSLTTSLSMIFIGMTLAGINMRNMLKKWWVFIYAPIKMIIMPIIFIHIFKLLGINEIIAGVVVIQAAMPAQTALTIVANEHGADYEYSAVAMFITTFASLATLPLVCKFIELWG